MGLKKNMQLNITTLHASLKNYKAFYILTHLVYEFSLQIFGVHACNLFNVGLATTSTICKIKCLMRPDCM